MVTKEQPRIENDPSSKLQTQLFLPAHSERQGEGGLRTKGYFKKSFDGSPLVSVITVVFNGHKYLEQTIQSVLNQSYGNIEYVIVDGGSTDGTLDVIRKYEHAIDYWVSEPDAGISDAMNKGVRISHGGYIMHLHSDDSLCRREAIEVLLEKLSSSKRNWATGFYKYIDSDSNVVKTDKPREYSCFDMLLRNIIRHQTTLVPRRVFEQVQFDTRFKYAMDYRFFLEVWEIMGEPFFAPEHITFFRLDGRSLSSNFYASIADEMYARKLFRIEKRQRYWLPFDYGIYFLRLLKIFFYHSRGSIAR
jgi:glycosyltransferase involved in cell wall biosynthesis